MLMFVRVIRTCGSKEYHLLQANYVKYRTRVANSAARSTGASELHADVGVHDVQHLAVRGGCARVGHRILPLRVA